MVIEVGAPMLARRTSGAYAAALFQRIVFSVVRLLEL
jgi:hypothetical protein